MRTLVGPHYSFGVRSNTELVAYQTSAGVWHAKLPQLGLIALGEPGESRGAVVQALGESLCEIWCTLVCVVQDRRTEWAACLTDEDRQLALDFATVLVEVRDEGSGHARHGMGRLIGRRPGSPLRRPELDRLRAALDQRLRQEGIFGRQDGTLGRRGG